MPEARPPAALVRPTPSLRSALTIAAGPALLAASACSTATPPAPPDTREPPPSVTAASASQVAAPTPSPLVAARPYKLDAPPDLDRARPAPLLLLLHPLGVTGAQFVDLIGVRELPREKGFVLAYPDGKISREGKTFWKASEACCDFHGEGDDDLAYLAAVLADVKAKHPVDPERIYVVGYSNGGFMAQRLACELPEIAAIVDLAGAAATNPDACRPKHPVAVLKIHGDKDQIVPYEGGQLGVEPKTAPVRPARAGAADWAARNGCQATPERAPTPLDYASSVPGPETLVERWAHCRGGADVELWTVQGAGHVFKREPSFAKAIVDFLVAHPRAK